jgi:hypothetical protein
MPGVYRPYTWVDILGTLNNGLQQATQGTTTITGISAIGEVDENIVMTDTVTGTVVSTAPGWNQATWGTFAWS